MDPVTHGLAGVVVRNLGFDRKAALGVLLFASMVPDLDYVTRLWGTDVFLQYHRGITHGVLALFVVPVVVGIVLRKQGFFYYGLIAFAGYGLHLFLDLTNQYGTRVLSPLDWRQYSLNLTFIIDPYVSVGLLLSAVLAHLNRKKAQRIAAVTLILLGAYLGVRSYLHEKTEDFLRGRLDKYVCTVYPLPNDFLRWWFVASSDDTIKTGFADLFTRRVYEQETYIRQSDPAIERSRGTRVVENFLNFAKYPYADIARTKGTVVITWKELAYAYLPGAHFLARVEMDEAGKVVHSDFTFYEFMVGH